MPAKFHVVRGNLWDRTFRNLSKEAKIVAFDVYTSPARTSEGLFELSTVHIAADTNLNLEEVAEAFRELSRAKLIDYDDLHEVVLDRLALRTNPLRNPRDEDGEPKLHEKGPKIGKPMIDNRIPHAVKLFAQLPDSQLKLEFLTLAHRYSPDLADAIQADSTYAWADFTQGPSKDLPSSSEGPSSSESLRVEEVPSRGEVHQLEPRDDEDQVMQSAAALVRQELNAEEAKYGAGGDEQW